MAPRTVAAVEVHHQIPRCLLGFWDRGHGPGLDAEDLAAWLDWEAEAFRSGVDPDVTRDELAALIDGSTVELAREEHRAIHSGQWEEWGASGGRRRSGATAPRGSRCWRAGAGRRSARRYRPRCS